MSNNNSVSSRPLAVDLDGTLLRTDSLLELALKAIGQGKWCPFITLGRGRAAFKQALADSVTLELDTLPWNDQVMGLINQVRASGRPVWLVTAANEALAGEVAAHFGFFEGVIASGSRNIKGDSKAEVLESKFGSKEFDYVGDAFCDLAVWSRCRIPYVVGNQRILYAKVKKLNPEAVNIDSASQGALFSLLKALRPHQWSKNLLVFVAMFLSHQFNTATFFTSLAAFAIFCLCSSGGYLINDLLDLESDRKHPQKNRRPFASGQVGLGAGVAASFALFGSALVLSLWLLPFTFLLVAVLYSVLTVSYSFHFKTVPLVDVIMLACLYTIRIVAGSCALLISVSPWILSFSMFLFLAVAIVKRISELAMSDRRQLEINARRGYRPEDCSVLIALTAGSICATVLTILLYVTDADSVSRLYDNAIILTFFCPVLFYWMARLLFLAVRGLLPHDPVLFALKDKVSYICLVIGLIVYVSATGFQL